jgi:EAL domain-containing protein (putative c-di-GMP-specific phosphodiesterase class I)
LSISTLSVISRVSREAGSPVSASAAWTCSGTSPWWSWRGETFTLTRLHDLGVRIAIDDFGTGYSSLSYLHRFPVDVLKIDRSFIERLSTGGDTALVSTILRLGQTLNLETVAEGIERPQEMLMLRRQGCTTGQGFHFSPPVPPAAVDLLLADQLHVAEEPEAQTPA